MRKLTTILALLAVVSLGSCKKDYTCECTYTDSSGFFATTTSSATLNGKKKDVKDACENGTYSSGTISYSCKIK
jgi:hypothetical protein